MYYKSESLGAGLLLILATAACWSVQLARADWEFRKQTPEGVARAIELAPTDTSYLAIAALQAEYAGGDPQPLLTRIVQLNPTSSAPRIRLGLAAEFQGDVARAEQLLQGAYEVDRQFETRWTLANFYLRQQRLDDFWFWIHSALEIQVADRRPVFDLLWRISSDPSEILSRAIPVDQGSLAAYLSYVSYTPHLDAILPAAGKLEESVGKRQSDSSLASDLLFLSCNVLLDAGRNKDAVQVWQLLGFSPPAGVTNPNFSSDRRHFNGQGFDWRMDEAQGVTHLNLETGGHRVKLSGDQAESVELLHQVVVGLKPGASYRLQWDARTAQLSGTTGIEWRIVDGHGPVVASDDIMGGQLVFQAQQEFQILSLAYMRPKGQTRAAGSVDLAKVQIEPAAATR